MRKYVLIFIGIVAVIACAVSFTSCEKERDIVGTWEMRINNNGLTDVYKYVFNADNSGFMSCDVTEVEKGIEKKGHYEYSFTYTYNKKTRKLTMKISSGGNVDKIAYKVNWANDNTFYLKSIEDTYDYSSYYDVEIGPFIRK